MKLISVNVSLPQNISWAEKQVPTSIFKKSVKGSVMLRNLNLDGDQQGNLQKHGGPDKAVCVYPCEHYTFWENELSRPDLPWGMFGENFTTKGLLEDEVCIGDQFRIGSALLLVTQPRTPCFKLGIKFEDPKVIDLMWAHSRSGFYASVLQEGLVSSGDSIEQISKNPNSLTVAEVFALYQDPSPNPGTIRRLLQLENLADEWKEDVRERMANQKDHPS